MVATSSLTTRSSSNECFLKCKIVRIVDDKNDEKNIETMGQIRMNKSRKMKKVLKAYDNEMYIRGTAFHKGFKHLSIISYDNIKEIIKSDKVPNMFIIEKYTPIDEKLGLIFEKKEEMNFFEKNLANKRPDLNLVLPSYTDKKKSEPELVEYSLSRIESENYYEVEDKPDPKNFFEEASAKVNKLDMKTFADKEYTKSPENGDSLSDSTNVSNEKNLDENREESFESIDAEIQNAAFNGRPEEINRKLSENPPAEKIDQDQTPEAVYSSDEDPVLNVKKSMSGNNPKTRDIFFTNSGILVERQISEEKDLESFAEKIIYVRKSIPEEKNITIEKSPTILEDKEKNTVVETSPKIVHSSTQIVNTIPQVIHFPMDTMTIKQGSNDIKINESGWVYLYAGIGK